MSFHSSALLLLLTILHVSAAPSASSPAAWERERARKRERENGYKKTRAARLAKCQEGLAVNDGVSSLFGGSTSGYHVSKTVFSERLRVVFIMGLEGTGHHAWTSIFNLCSRGICAYHKELTRLLYSGESIPEGIFAYGSNPEDSDEQVGCRQAHFDRLLGDLRRNSTTPELLFLNTAFYFQIGHMSYPSYNGKDKALHSPDMHALAALCERASIDLRIVVMQRSAEAIVASTANRDFGSFPGHEISTLTNNAAVVAAQLQLM